VFEQIAFVVFLTSVKLIQTLKKPREIQSAKRISSLKPFCYWQLMLTLGKLHWDLYLEMISEITRNKK